MHGRAVRLCSSLSWIDDLFEFSVRGQAHETLALGPYNNDPGLAVLYLVVTHVDFAIM